MKRRDLIRHLEGHGCVLDREGGNHSIYRNPANGRCTSVPRHREIKPTTAKRVRALRARLLKHGGFGGVVAVYPIPTRRREWRPHSGR